MHALHCATSVESWTTGSGSSSSELRSRWDTKKGRKETDERRLTTDTMKLDLKWCPAKTTCLCRYYDANIIFRETDASAAR